MMRLKYAANGVCALVLALLLAGPARADVVNVDVELVLAVDVSLSMDLDEQALQRGGYVAAFRDADIVAAINANALGRIAVAYVEWAGVGNNRITIPWTLIDSAEAGAAFAARLEKEPISRWRKTSISAGLLLAAGLFEATSFKGERRVIDISGDGPNNDGFPVETVRDRLVAKGIVINGLPVILKSPVGWFDMANLDEYYEDCVIGGMGSFVITVRKKEEFTQAIKRKLLHEISDLGRPRVIRAQLQTSPEKPLIRKRVDCLIGEKRWQQYMGGN